MNVKEAKMIINSEKIGKIRKEGKFLFAVTRKGVGRNSISCQSGASVVVVLEIDLEQDHDFKCWTFVDQERDTEEECSGVELSVQYLGAVEKFCYLGDIMEEVL